MKKTLKNLTNQLFLYKNQLIKIIDFCIIVMVVSYFIINYTSNLILFLENTIKLTGDSDFVTYTVNNATQVTEMQNTTTNTTTSIIHNDGSFSNTIRTLFIYGSGAFRISMLRNGGSPGSRFAVIGSSIAMDYASKIANNIINDPDYIRKYSQYWGLKQEGEVLNIDESGDSKTNEAIKTAADTASNLSNNFLPDSIGSSLEELSEKIFSQILQYFSSYLEPIQVSYSQDLLAAQIYHLAIVLFIITVLLSIFIIAFIFNLIIYIYSDKISSYFKNKYIVWYINLNKKIIGIELFILSSTILYSVYILSYGLHFIATHPISFN